MKFEEFSVFNYVVLTGCLNLDNITEPFGLRFNVNCKKNEKPMREFITEVKNHDRVRR